MRNYSNIYGTCKKTNEDEKCKCHSQHSGSLVSSIITVAGDDNGLMLNPTVDVRLSCSVKYVTFPSSSHSVSSEMLYSRHSSAVPSRNFIFRLHSSVYSALETSPASIQRECI